MGNQGGNALKWLPAHFNYEKRNTPKSERERPSTLRDWSPCSPIQRDGGWRSRPGVSPFISALTVARCPAIFSEMWPHFGTLCPQVGAQYEGRGLSYTPCLLMKTDLRLRLHATQAQPCFPAAPPRRQRHFHGNAGRAYNTLHFASQSRVPNGGVAPFGNPPQEKAVRYPSTGRIPPFLVIQPSGCIG